MNIIKLFTVDGEIYVDAKELNQPHRTLLRIYTSRGNKLSDVGITKEIRERASWGVHRDNLFATKELAEADRERIFKEIYGDAYQPPEVAA